MTGNGTRQSVHVTPGTLQASIAFGWKTREAFYSQIIAQHANGVSLQMCLELFERRATRNRAMYLAGIARAMRSAMNNGYDFAEAVAPWVPREETSQIAAGVLGNNLTSALETLIESREMIKGITAHIRAALITPAVNLLIGVLFFVFMAVSIVPQFQGIVPRSAASGSVAALYALSAFAVSFWFWGFITLVVLAGAGVWFALPRWTGPSRVIADRYFPFNLYREFQGYLWLSSYVSIVGAGVREVRALDIQAERSSPWMAERLHLIGSDMASGSSLPEALFRKRYAGSGFDFPSPEIVETIEAIHGFEDFPVRMSGVLKRWIHEFASRVRSVGTIVGVVGSVMTYGVIMFITIASVNLQNQAQDRASTMSTHVQTR